MKGDQLSPGRMRASLVLALLLASALACDEDGAVIIDDGPPPGIVGSVLDADSVAVAGAPVGLIYGIYQGQDGWPPAEIGGDTAQPRETVTFMFTLSDASTVRFLVQDFLYRPRRVLIDGAELEAGEHGVQFDWTDDEGAPLPNGLYGTRLEITRPGFSDVQEEGGLLRNSLSLDFGTEVGTLVIADADGSFRIPFSELPIGAWSYCWDGEDGICTITDTLWIQSAVEGFGARRLLSIGDFQADLPLILRCTQRRD